MLEQRRKPGVNDTKTNDAIAETQKMPQLKRIKEEPCCLCGVLAGDIPAKKIISSAFTNWDLLRNPGSETICDYCAIAIKTLRLRQSSWVATPKAITLISRDKIANMLFAPISTPFIFNVTTSFKKLGQIKAPVNADSQQFIVQFEDEQVVFSPSIADPIYRVMCVFYSIPANDERKNALGFFTKTEMRTGEYKYGRIQNFGQANWEAGEKILKQHRRAPFFRLLLHALNQEKLGIAGRNIIKKEKNNADKPPVETRAGTEKNSEGTPLDGQGLDLPDLEVDSLGQCKWFS